MGVDYVEDTAALYTLEETKILDASGKIHDVVGLCVRFLRFRQHHTSSLLFKMTNGAHTATDSGK